MRARKSTKSGIGVYIWGKKLNWYTQYWQDASFWGFSSTYLSKRKNITRRLRNMVDSAFESWWSIFSNHIKILAIRTHPEELRVIKCASSTHICTNFSQQWGQRMLTKCCPTSQGCSCDFPRLKVWHLGVTKPYRTSSYNVLSLLTKSTLFVFVFDSTNFPQNAKHHTNCWSQQQRWYIVWWCSIRFWNAQRSYFQS